MERGLDMAEAYVHRSHGIHPARLSQEDRVKTTAIFLLGALLAPCAASAGDGGQAFGSGALALAALVGGNSPLLGDKDKAALAKLLDGNTKFDFLKGQTITVTADKVTCHASNIDIAEHNCTLAFGKQDVTLKGRAAHELYATLLEIGVEPDAGAGNIWVGVSKLDCAIDVAEVQDKAGGGAKCHFASNG
jgi:hypothetical protein